MKILPVLTLSILLACFSCRKTSFISSKDAQITITADTLKFDTVFTSAGSVTQSFKIINDNNQPLRLTSVKLMGGSTAAFKMNVDGTAGPEVDNLELAAYDSLYVFVQVNIDPNADQLPFVLKDSIQISYNGNDRQVQLEAWGQNAHFLRNKIITTDETWNNDLPYVILGYLSVNANATLTINKGCRIYMHADAPLIIDGSLKVAGEKDTADRVYFRGDRLDEPYKDYPAAWPGIFFRQSSHDNTLTFAVIKNAYQAIALQDPSPNASPKLTLNECMIDNAYDAGIISLNSSITATNCLVSNCGKNIVLAKGGNYTFTHCTAVSISNNFILHKEPVLYISNFITDNNTPVPADLNAVFRNCIFWGENGTAEDEVVAEKTGGAAFNALFDYGLWKVTNVPAAVSVNQVISNISPAFDSVNTAKNYYNFRLKEGSPAIDAGTNAGITLDLDGNPRPVGLPDLGCYEKQ
jgi:hypothetical protein